MTNGWLTEQLKIASKEVEQWPEWKKRELRAEPISDRVKGTTKIQADERSKKSEDGQ